MRPPVRRRARVRAALEATTIPTWSTARGPATSAEAIRFTRAPGRLPAGRRIYAIGDVHGCLEQLHRLHQEIARDIAARPIASPLLIYLGDYIDHGPDSAGVLDLLISGASPAHATHLMGDHERMLLEAIDGDRAAATDWLWTGGRAALVSWGLDPELPRDQWAGALPPRHIAFLRSLGRMHREGGYLFVHAGIRPGVPLEEQSPDDLLSIRQPFLSSDQPLGLVVVHGHSSAPAVTRADNRIGIDTGAGMGGKLTCAVLEDDVIGLLEVQWQTVSKTET